MYQSWPSIDIAKRRASQRTEQHVNGRNANLSEWKETGLGFPSISSDACSLIAFVGTLLKVRLSRGCNRHFG